MKPDLNSAYSDTGNSRSRCGLISIAVYIVRLRSAITIHTGHSVLPETQTKDTGHTQSADISHPQTSRRTGFDQAWGQHR
eukprot:4574993-Prymnesium_polylepis.1